MKKNARPHKNAEPSAQDSANSKLDRLTPRQDRLLRALLKHAGWISREKVDRIAGASNGPQIVLEVRRKVTGHDGIEMRRVDAVDRDGKPCKPGRYRLTPQGRKRAAAWLPGKGDA
jgi:hypothetical protein